MLGKLLKSKCQNPGCEKEPPEACRFCMECRISRQSQGLVPGHHDAAPTGWRGLIVALAVFAGGMLCMLVFGEILR